MKTTKTLILVLMVFALVLFVYACKKNPEQKVADAQANVASAQQDVANAKVQGTAAEEWTAFKAEQLLKIDANDKIIADYKAMKTNTKGKLLASYDKKIDALELKNKELRTKLDNYDANGKTTWEVFKSEFNKNMDELNLSLKNYTTDKK